MNRRGEPVCSPTVGLPNPCPHINFEPKTNNETDNVGADRCVRPNDNRYNELENDINNSSGHRHGRTHRFAPTKNRKKW